MSVPCEQNPTLLEIQNYIPLMNVTHTLKLTTVKP